MRTSHLLTAWVLVSSMAITYAQRKKQTATVDESLHESVEYRLLGPFRGGRSAAVTGVPGSPDLFYFGATGGGVWRTTNGGDSWENISDGFFGGSIGAVSVAPSDPNVIYVGGGEKTVRGNVSSGYGMWKSEDAGKSWKEIGLQNSRHISRVRIHPNDPNTVFAAVMGNIYKPTEDRGVYKSTDGGVSWKKVLYANSMAGAVDLILDPNNPRILYASTWRVQRTPYSLSSGGDGSALWKSTDSGETWELLSDNEGFAKGTLGIIGVAVSPANSQRVWAIVENKDEGGVYRSEDGGNTWARINEDRSLRQRAWYYTRIYADTQDEDVVYVLNVDYHKSQDGGKSFSSFEAPHGDHHDLWIAPEDPKRMIMGDDGGAQVSFDGGNTWSTYHNQPTAQFYRLTTDNHFPYRIYAAQQDNSTIRLSHRSDGGYITEDDWEETAGGESAHIAVDPLDNDIVYGGSYGGFLTRVNHDAGTVRAVNVWPDNPMGYGAEGMKYRFQWNFPIMYSRHNPKRLYAFSNHVHYTENEGQSWTLASDDLTRNDPEKLKSSGGPITQDNTGVEYYATLFAANESPLKEGLLWVGSDDGLIHLSRDGAKTWEDVTPKDAPKWLMINSIDPSPFDEATCYVAGTLYKEGDFTPYLYKTTNYGASWTKITYGIHPEHFTRVLRADPEVPGLLYAGTETGMYISYDDGASWKPFQKNLPIVPITDLAIKENDLIVATQGRSIWSLDNLDVIRKAISLKSSSEPVLFAPETAYRTNGYGGHTSVKAGTNLPNGVITHFYLPTFDKEKDTILLTFMDQKGDTIKSFGNRKKEDVLKDLKAGGNTFVWDMRYPGAERLKGMILWWANLNGAKAVPGNYRVKLSVNGTEMESGFTIKADPRAEASVADMQEQFTFVKEVNETVDKAHKSIKKMRAIRGKLNEFLDNFESDEDVKDLADKARAMKDQLDEVEEALYQVKNRSGQDPLNFPIKLTNKLAHLNSLVTMGDFAPTSQDRAVKEELTGKIEIQLRAFDKVLDDEVAAFNEAFRAKGLPYLKVD